MLVEQATVNLQEDVMRLQKGLHSEAHKILGCHPEKDEGSVIRLWRPGAKEIYIQIKGQVVPLNCIDPSGLFEIVWSSALSHEDYQVYHSDGSLGYDPYAFLSTLGEMDAHLFAQGTHYELYRVLGARLCQHQGCDGVKFTLWAPHARSVSLVADFNHWDIQANPCVA